MDLSRRSRGLLGTTGLIGRPMGLLSSIGRSRSHGSSSPRRLPPVADLRFGEGGVVGKGLCVPKARSARGGPGHAPPWEMFEI